MNRNNQKSKDDVILRFWAERIKERFWTLVSIDLSRRRQYESAVLDVESPRVMMNQQ